MNFHSIILSLTLFFLLLHCRPQHKDQSDIVSPKLLSNHVSLEYPEEAIDNKNEGEVILLIHINEDGNVDTINVFRSSGSDALDLAALEMISRAKFKPGTIDGEISDFWIKVPVDFNLNPYEITWAEITNWREKVLTLFAEIDTGGQRTKKTKLRELFRQYEQMVKRSVESRSRSANKGIFEILNKPLAAKWLEYQTTWPLGFLLFQDYLDRFPDSEYAANAKNDKGGRKK